MSNCKIFAIANQKGGVAKTTTACNMGYALLEMGKKVMLVDFDPQANLSMCVGIERPDEVENAMPKLLSAALSEDEMPDVSAYIQMVNGMDIISSSLSLAENELNLRDEVGGQMILKNILDPLRDKYDYIIIDTNPYLGILTINALSACDEVIIPASPHLWSATGLTDLISTITKVKRKINKGISIKGILFTICDGNTKLFKHVTDLIQETYGEEIRIFESKIPRTTKQGEANYMSTSIFQHAPKSAAARAYANFAKEVVA